MTSPSPGWAGVTIVTLRAIFLRFWPLTKPLRSRLYVTLVLVVVAPVLSTAGIGMFKILVDRVVVPHNFRLFPLIALAYLGLTLAQGAVSFVDQYLSTWIGERFVMGLRTRLFSHVHRLSMGFFESRPLGDLLSRLTGDIGAIENLVLSGAVQFLSYVIKLVLFTGALFYLDWRLAAASLLAAPVFLLAARSFSRRIKIAAREKRRRTAGITSVAEESFSNAALVRSYDRVEGEDARFDEQNVAMFAAQMAATRLQALFAPLTDLIEVIGVLLVIGLAIWELAAGRITIGGLLVFLAYLAQLYGPIQGLSGLTNSLYAASASAERVIELLDETPTITNPATAHPLGRASGAVALHGVGFTYPGTHTAALSDITLQVAPGQTVALVGASGAGKSTLAKLLLRFYDPDQGAITLDGIDLRQLCLTELYRNIANVLQETLVFDATVRENILWGHPGATEQQILDAAHAADAAEFIRALPHGYDTPIGQRGRKLSGGQRQRLAIARAMIRDAPVLLLDEPTTGLDAESTRRILTPLRRLIAGRTTIIISHNLHTVIDADLIVYLEHGRITATGTHPHLLQHCPGYRHLYHQHHTTPENPPSSDAPVSSIAPPTSTSMATAVQEGSGAMTETASLSNG
jgi:ATP-binding cassette, subfamily B, bacterial